MAKTLKLASIRVVEIMQEAGVCILRSTRLVLSSTANDGRRNVMQIAMGPCGIPLLGSPARRKVSEFLALGNSIWY